MTVKQINSNFKLLREIVEKIKLITSYYIGKGSEHFLSKIKKKSKLFLTLDPIE